MRFLLLVLVLALVGCSATSVEKDCDNLLRIESIPMKATYAEILKTQNVQDSKDLDACLADRITDAVVVADPREAPPVQSYMMGDTAFFLLVMKHGWKIEDMIAGPYSSRWKERGIYAYFEYVNVEGNRHALQERVFEALDGS